MTTKARANWRTPDATKTKVDENADRIGWLKERRNGIGGTDAAALLGVHVSLKMSTAKNVTPATVFLDKVSTEEPAEDDKTIFAFGHLLEPRLMRNIADAYDLQVRPGGFYRNKAEPFRYANPDGLTSDGGIAEGKTASNRSRAAESWYRGDVSDHAYVQTQHYLAVTGRTHSYYGVAIRDDYTNWEQVPRDLWHTDWFSDMAVKDFIEVGPIDRDEKLIEQILDAERRFWDAVQTGVMPPELLRMLPAGEAFKRAEDSREVEAVVPDMVADDVARLRVIKDAQKDLKTERERIEESLKRQIGTGEFLTANGQRIARWSNTKTTRFDKKGLAEAHPGLIEEFTLPNPGRQLTLIDPPKEKKS